MIEEVKTCKKMHNYSKKKTAKIYLGPSICQQL